MSGRTDLTPEMFRFHTRCFSAPNPIAGSFSNLAYPERPNFRHAIAQHLHGELGLDSTMHVLASTTEMLDEAVAEYDLHFNVVGLKKSGKGEAILVSAIAVAPSGVAMWTRDHALPVGGSPAELGVYFNYQGPYWEPAPLPAAARARLKALTAKKPAARSTRLVTPDIVSALAFSPDGATLAACDRAGNLTLFDVGDGRVRHRLSVAKSMLRAVVFHPDGRSVFTGARDVKQVDVASGAVTAKLGKFKYDISRIAVSPSGDLIAAASAGISVLECAGGAERCKADLFDVEGLEFDGETHVVAARDLGPAGLRRFALGTKPPRPLPLVVPGPGFVRPLREGLLSRLGDEFVIYDPTTLAERRRFTVARGAHGERSVERFETNGEALVLVGESFATEVRLVDAATGAVVRSYVGTTPMTGDPIRGAMAVARDGRVAMAINQTVTIWNADGQPHLTPVA